MASCPANFGCSIFVSRTGIPGELFACAYVPLGYPQSQLPGYLLPGCFQMHTIATFEISVVWFSLTSGSWDERWSRITEQSAM